jgi:RNA polymerase sigma-70 factor (ECF subfamily)
MVCYHVDVSRVTNSRQRRLSSRPLRTPLSSPPDPSFDDLSRSLAGEKLPDPTRSLVLLARAQQGDRAALEDLVARYQERIHRIVRIQLASSSLRRDLDSMDLVQSTFRAALPKIGDLRPRSAAGLLQWLALIATNQIRDAYAGQRALKRDIAREIRDESASELVLHPTPSASEAPDRQAELDEIRELLDSAVARLPDDQRRVVLLRDYCGEEWDRIAAELERDNGATRQLHQRAWIRLRHELRPKLEGRE